MVVMLDGPTCRLFFILRVIGYFHWMQGHIAVARADLGHHPCYGAGGYEPRGPARRQAWIDRGAVRNEERSFVDVA